MSTPSKGPVFPRPNKVIDTVEQSYFNCILYGASGVGKTTCAATAPTPILFLDCDEGLETIRSIDSETAKKVGIINLDEIYSVPIRGLADVVAQIKRVRDENTAHPGWFKTVVLDNLTEFQRILMDDILRQQDRTMPQQQDWGLILRRVEVLVREIRNLPAHTVFVAQEEKNENGIAPALSGKMKIELPQFVDLMARYTLAEREERGADGKTVIQQVRKLRCQPLLGPNPVEAKTRGWKFDAWESPNISHLIEKRRK